MVQVKVNEVPEVIVAVVEAFDALTKVAVPPLTVHNPVPGLGLLPTSVTTGVVLHTLLVELAVAETGVVTVNTAAGVEVTVPQLFVTSTV